MTNWTEQLKQNGYTPKIWLNESMAEHCTLRMGGPADFFTRPETEEQLQLLILNCHKTGMPFMLLGGGANILVADEGIRGLVIETSALNQFQLQNMHLTIGAGCDVSVASEWAQKKGLAGLEWINRMPGSFGGAVWMNARCYGYEIADILVSVQVLTPAGEIQTHPFSADQWAYKRSPFQQSNEIILSATVKLKPGDKDTLKQEMKRIASDRINKGHFRKPSAGSTFKNNRAFGAPSGVIIDQCGLRGLNIGDAAVSDWHANILINRGHASSRDFLRLIQLIQEEVEKQTGFLLEPEVLPVGDWRTL